MNYCFPWRDVILIKIYRIIIVIILNIVVHDGLIRRSESLLNIFLISTRWRAFVTVLRLIYIFIINICCTLRRLFYPTTLFWVRTKLLNTTEKNTTDLIKIVETQYYDFNTFRILLLLFSKISVLLTSYILTNTLENIQGWVQ